jgi:hypothetical protein
MAKKKKLDPDEIYTPSAPGSRTSAAAAAGKASSAATDEALVFDYIDKQEMRGATDDEVEQALGMLHQGASARRRAPVLKHRVVDSQKTRRTRTGCGAAVWVTVASITRATTGPS